MTPAGRAGGLPPTEGTCASCRSSRALAALPHGFHLAIDVAKQVLIAGAAAAGVLLVAGGCGGRPAPQLPAAGLNPGGPNPGGVASAQPGNSAGQIPAYQPPGGYQPGPAMGSPIGTRPRVTIVEDPPQDGGLLAEGTPRATPRPSVTGRVQPRANANAAIDPSVDPAVANPRERERARRAEADAMMNDAMAPAALPATGGASAALRATDRAVAPLADTLAAIESAQRVVVDNLRNVEAAGFKASRSAVGDGRDVASQIDPSQGELLATQRALDVAIQGEGFLQITVYTPEHPAGVTGFTRNGKLFMNRQGEIVVGQLDGYQLLPPLKLPPGATQVQIDQDGRVNVTRAGADDPKPTGIGQITLARFTDPTALRPLGGGIYAETEASGQAVESPANDRGAGAILQGHLEASNVDLVRERMRLRFLQGWRASIIGALDGDPHKPAAR